MNALENEGLRLWVLIRIPWPYWRERTYWWRNEITWSFELYCFQILETFGEWRLKSCDQQWSVFKLADCTDSSSHLAMREMASLWGRGQDTISKIVLNLGWTNYTFAYVKFYGWPYGLSFFFWVSSLGIKEGLSPYYRLWPKNFDCMAGRVRVLAIHC